ncbi:unnamed protein product [Gongylonema pulchrum]|uniref:Uncharacterized protein n=1 Tax=Gongylonema pulchrum TaxID=637853 RepID=A0A183EAQ2_9BILA|nr:unnamed protein product [Gongylonema pulchrum]
MLEQMSAELEQLSALYSAKCLENSQLDEKMSLLLADKENHSSSSAVEIQNRRLQREIRQKDAVIEELRQKVTFLERRVADLTGEELPLRYGRIRSFSSGLFFTFAHYDMILLLIHQRHEEERALIFD